jgi:hypothetical protein
MAHGATDLISRCLHAIEPPVPIISWQSNEKGSQRSDLRQCFLSSIVLKAIFNKWGPAGSLAAVYYSSLIGDESSNMETR